MSNKPFVPGSIDFFQNWLDSKKTESVDTNSPESSATPTSTAQQSSLSSFQSEKGQTLTFENVRIDFPLKPYAAQVQMMKNIVHSLNGSENALLESPTGSGKSLALLCAALAWRENEERKIAIQRMEKEEKIKTEKVIVEEIKEGDKTILNITKEENVKATKEGDKPMLDITNKEKVIIDIIDSQSPPPEGTPPLEEYIPEKRKNVAEQDKPENWAKRFKCTDKAPIFVRDDSLDDFQPVIPIKKRSVPVNYEEDREANPPALSNTATKEQINSTKEEAYKIPRIFVGSRTHKQITQLVSELKKKTRYNPRTTILGGREHLCINPKVMKAQNKTEACVDLLDKNACTYFGRTRNVLNHPSLRSTNKIWDIEDLVKLGKKVKGCPYYAARKTYEFAEVIFCPYNYIIDPIIREILDINLKGSIIILDEAHNIEDSSRSAGSCEIDQTVLDKVIIELDQIIRNGFEEQAHRKIEVFIKNLYQLLTDSDNVYTIKEYEIHYCHWTGKKILQKLDQFVINADQYNLNLKPAYKTVAAHAEMIRKEKESRELEEATSSSQIQIRRRQCLSNNSLTIIQGIFMVLGFLFQQDKNYAEDYQMVLTKRVERTNNQSRRKKRDQDADPGWEHKLGFKCLNPGIIFRDMTETTRSVILTSGTLSPLNTFASELETKFEGRLEANHVIHKSQVWVGAVGQGPQGDVLRGVYSNMQSFGYQDDIGAALVNIVETVPFGVLCFMPSYSALDGLVERWKKTDIYDRLSARKLILSEPKGSDKNEFEKTIGKFYKQVDDVALGSDQEGRDGALFFAVFRGKVSEGIDFPDNYCRAVVTIGIPYPGLKDVDVKFKKEYNDMKRIRDKNSDILTSQQWYSAQAFRAVNQALGRCIRHKNDWGAIILLEERFQSTLNRGSLSKWVRNQFQMYQQFNEASHSLKEFVTRQLERTQQMATLAASLTVDSSPQALNLKPPEITTSELTNTPEVASLEFVDVPESIFDYVPTQVPPAEDSLTAPTETNNNVHNYSLHQQPINIPPSNEKPRRILPNNSVFKKSSPPYTKPSLSLAKKSTSIALPSIPRNTSEPPVSPPSMTIPDEGDDEIFQFKAPQAPAAPQAPLQRPVNPPVESQWLPTPAYPVPQAPVNNMWLPASHQPVKNIWPPTPAYPIRQRTRCLKREDLYHGPGSHDNSDVTISCSHCGKDLLEGKKSDLYPIEVDLSLLQENPLIDHENLIEVFARGWTTSLHLRGGPLDVTVWPNEVNMTLNMKDGVCYRFIHCACRPTVPIGLILRQHGDQSEFDGRVFIWPRSLQFEKQIKPEPIEDHMFFSSQIPSFNDQFYNLG